MSKKPILHATHMATSIEALFSNQRSKLLCTICGAAMGKCDCWTKCKCGWRYEKGTSCHNPECATGKGKK